MAGEPGGWSQCKAEKRVLHERYIALWCGTVFVGLVAYYNFENTHLVELLSFTSTITSLILAVLAIVYAVYSGSEMDKSLVQLTGSAQLTQQMNSDALKSFEALKIEMRDLHKAVRDSHEYLQSLGGQLLGDNTRGILTASSKPVGNTAVIGTSISTTQEPASPEPVGGEGTRPGGE